MRLERIAPEECRDGLLVFGRCCGRESGSVYINVCVNENAHIGVTHTCRRAEDDGQAGSSADGPQQTNNQRKRHIHATRVTSVWFYVFADNGQYFNQVACNRGFILHASCSAVGVPQRCLPPTSPRLPTPSTCASSSCGDCSCDP